MARAFGADRSWVVLDPMLRIIDVAALDQADLVLDSLSRAPQPSPAFAPCSPAPILSLAHVFEPELCAHLVDCFEQAGGKDSGFMQDVGGRSVENFDNSWKRRRDFHLTDAKLIADLRARIGRRICPEIRKAFQMRPTRIERDLVARYDAKTGGHFGPHRDDTGIAIAHRRFAVSINLNTDFEGGEISFPEYSPQSFKAAPGTAVVFSASILLEGQGQARSHLKSNIPWSHEWGPVQSVARDPRAPLCVPDLPVRRGGGAGAAGEFARRAGGPTPAATDERMRGPGRATRRSPWVAGHLSPNRAARPCGRPAPSFRSRSE
jgi:2OG-Fe(II) oxygenase superfamily